MDVQHLAKILWEEFERDAWGDIDPDLFRCVAEGKDVDGGPLANDAAGLQDVLQRAVDRLESEDSDG